MGESQARPSIVPFVAAWNSELPGLETDLTIEPTPEPRLAYRGTPRKTDRDGAGVLWARMSHSPYAGRPIFDSMHPARQYICMYGMNCQVCGYPASRNKAGWLFFDWRKPWDPPTWPEGSRTAQPPLCDAHAPKAVEQCPFSPDFIALRVKKPRLWGVSGTPYQRTTAGWRTGDADAMLPYGDPGLRAVLATKLVRELRNITVVDLPQRG
ncbi:hypothetical protein [Streptomyces sp. DSM 118878]